MNWVDVARTVVPKRLRYALQRLVSLRDLKLRLRRQNDPLADVVAGDDNPTGSPVRFGIVRNSAMYHTQFVRACQEVGVPFRVIDLASADWLEEVSDAGCDVLFVWPDAVLSQWNRMIKDRATVLESELGYAVVPSSRELWLYEDKRRTAYWLVANGFPSPETWVFYDRAEAGAFAESCRLPVVFKTSFGAAASGVAIVRSRGALKRLIRKAFSRGIAPGGTDWRDRQWGSIILQQYLPDVGEWRVVRIGDSFMSRFKERRGDFHSGAGVVRWGTPSREVLDLAREVTEVGGFRSMGVDIFETRSGEVLVNELQAVVGPIRESNMERGSEHRGRWLFDSATGEWSFESGDFYRNACANLRVIDALERGLKRASR